MAMLAVTSALVSIDRWADASITQQLTEDGATVIRVDAIVLRCSLEYFWGHDVLLIRPDEKKVWRRVCRDWQEGRWYPAGGL